MEYLIKELKFPFIIVAALLIVLVLLNVAGLYNSFWQGKLAQVNHAIAVRKLEEMNPVPISE